MPKAILRFTLPEEREEFESAYKAINYRCAWEGLHDCLRNDEFTLQDQIDLTPEQYKVLYRVREIMDEITKEQNIIIE